MKHLRKFLLFGVIILIYFDNSYSQKKDSLGFASPLNIPILLSGNYGELRTNHFHGGIDLKTGGEIGKPIFAAADGYVARVKVQANGYGNSIYINHPNGYTSVYAHLDRYIPSIHKYVKESQYKSHSFEIDLFPPKTMFRVKKGDLIGYTGNSGGSGGPHLHFELRKTKEETPMNVLLYNFPVYDTRPPEYRALHVYSMFQNSSVGNSGEYRTTYKVTRTNSSAYEVSKTIKCSTDFIGFSVEAYDYLNGAGNRCGIYKLELKIDGNTYFLITIDNIPFALTRNLNAHIDYELKVNENKSVHKLFRLPNNVLNIYSNVINDGIYQIPDDTVHEAEIIAYDPYENKSTLKFKFQKYNEMATQLYLPDSSMYTKVNQTKNIKLPGLRVVIPAGSLYRDAFLSFSSVKGFPGSLSDTYYIHLPTEPLKANMTLLFNTDSINSSLGSKLIFARINGGGKPVSEGGEWSNNRLMLKTKNFGRYVVMIDTIPPDIYSVNFYEGKKFETGQQIIFRVKDDLSGIKTYNAYINDKWALLEYDPKFEKMYYYIDPEKIARGSLNKLKLFIMDDRNNVRVYEGKFRF